MRSPSIFATAALIIAFSLPMSAGAQTLPMTSQTPAASKATTAIDDPSYQLGVGDKIRVITFGEESLTGEFLVDDQGRVPLPLIGEVQAGGLTIAQFTDSIQKALASGFLKNPRVSVEVLTYRPYYILGEVSRPGEYPYVAGLTVMNAAATAGGFTYRANTHKVFIRGAHDPKESSVHLKSTTVVHPGDTIRIPERFF